MSEKSKQYPSLRLEDELKTSYLNYAMSVIVSRALPDARDGLKPSQRRILVAMRDLNLGPSSKFRKCAKIAGDTSGNYHPHGEAVVYPTLVRMAQDFNMRYTLVKGQGNFGSLDGDPAAAMRYTEAKLTAFSTMMMEDIEKDTVDYVPNYDETRTEPTVLPSKFPNFLVNGGVGIAVGMSTSVPPNNLTEVCDGIVKVIEEPDISVEDLCQIIPGPDFPTGAIICGSYDSKNAYTTGRGGVTVRSRADVEEKKNGRCSLIFSEIPYQQNKARIIERIAELVKDGKLVGISDVRDESGRDETVRIVVDLKKGENSDVILNQLFKYTSLQSNFSIIMLALINGRPKTINIKEMMVCFIEFRQEVIRRRTVFLLAKAEARHHLVMGLLIAQQNIDAVIKTIRQSSDPKEAKEALQKNWKLSKVQAEAIIQMRLGTLTGLEQEKLKGEKESLEAEITEFKDILANESRILEMIKNDILEIRNKYGDRRRSEIGLPINNINIEDMIPDDQWAVLVTNQGYLKRMSIELYRKQNRGGSGITGVDIKDGDFAEHFFIASAHQYLLIFSDHGKLYWLKVYDIPEFQRNAKGRPIANLLSLAEDETVTSLIPVKEFDDRWLVMATEQGIIKKTALSAFSRPNKNGIRAINLDEGNRLISTVLTDGNQDILLATRLGRACRFHEKQMRPLGRSTRGVLGVRLAKDDTVIGMVIADADHSILTICEKGYGKRSSFDSYRVTKRGVQGVLNVRRSDKTGDVISIRSVCDEDEIMIITSKGMVIRMEASLRMLSRATQGVRLIRLKDNDRVVSVAKLAKEQLDQLDEGNEEEGEGEETSEAAAVVEASVDASEKAPAEADSGE